MTSRYRICNFGIITIQTKYKTGECYCGTHAHFITYPQSNLITISMSVHTCIYLGLVFKYSLLDKNSVIKHYPLRFNHFISPFMASFIFPNENSTLKILLIQAVEYQQIKINTIHCKRCIVTIYDGPGIKLEKLNWKNTVLTASFQCLIYIKVLRKYFFEEFFIKNVNYTTVLAEIKVLHANTKKNILLDY